MRVGLIASGKLGYAKVAEIGCRKVPTIERLRKDPSAGHRHHGPSRYLVGL